MIAKPAPAEPASDKPATSKPASDKPATSKPASDKPETDKPATSKPACDKPAISKSACDEPSAEIPSALPTAASKAPSPAVVAEASPTPSTSSATSSAPVASRPTQSLVCKFPFSPLKRVNVTVKEDGIVTSPTTNHVLKINQPVRTLSPSADGSLMKAIKLIPETRTSATTLLANSPRFIPKAGVIKPNVFVPMTASATVSASASASPVQRRFPILRAMPRPNAPGPAEHQRQAVLIDRSGTAVPMTVLRNKAVEKVLKLVSPSVRSPGHEKVYIASLPVVKSAADVRSVGLKVLHPNIPPNKKRLLSPTKTIRILKSVSLTDKQDGSVRTVVTPKAAAAPSASASGTASASASGLASVSASVPVSASASGTASEPISVPSPAASSAPAVAEIDTTELLID